MKVKLNLKIPSKMQGMKWREQRKGSKLMCTQATELCNCKDWK